MSKQRTLCTNRTALGLNSKTKLKQHKRKAPVSACVPWRFNTSLRYSSQLFSMCFTDSTLRFHQKTNQLMLFLSFIQLLVCLTTGSLPLQRPVLHRVRSYASSSNSQYLLAYLTLSSSCLRLLSRLPPTSTLLSVFLIISIKDWTL
jgi:hypothetical protein